MVREIDNSGWKQTSFSDISDDGRWLLVKDLSEETRPASQKQHSSKPLRIATNTKIVVRVKQDNCAENVDPAVLQEFMDLAQQTCDE